MEEVWKTVSDFEYYCVSSFGRVRSQKFGRTLILAQNAGANGYLKVGLCARGRLYSKEVHRLVLETFIGTCPDGMEARHLDGNQQNNRLTNLTWGTHSENIRDSIIHGTYTAPICPPQKGELNFNSKLSENDVNEIRKIGRTKPQREVAVMFGVTRQAISNILLGKSW